MAKRGKRGPGGYWCYEHWQLRRVVLRARSAALHSKNRAVLILANAMLDAVGGPPRKIAR